MVEKNLQVVGCVAAARTWSLAELATLGELCEIADSMPKRRGRGLRFADLIAEMQVDEEARYVFLKSRQEEFAISVPLLYMMEAILVIDLDGDEYPQELGGPIRLFIPDPKAAAASDQKICANVKDLGLIEFCVAERAGWRPPSDDSAPTS